MSTGVQRTERPFSQLEQALWRKRDLSQVLKSGYNLLLGDRKHNPGHGNLVPNDVCKQLCVCVCVCVCVCRGVCKHGILLQVTLKMQAEEFEGQAKGSSCCQESDFIQKPLFRASSFLTYAIKSSMMIGTISVLCISYHDRAWHAIKHSRDVYWINR